MTATDLFENLCSHMVAAVENDPELPTPLHFFEKRSGVLRVKRELTDLKPDVISRWGHYQLLQSYET